MTQNCPSLVCMHCATTCVSFLRGERDLCDLHIGHGSDRELQFILAEGICDLHTGHLHNGHGSDRELQFYIAGRPM